MEKISTKVTYLEMIPPVPRAPVPVDIAIAKADRPTVAFYRFLYDQAGGPYLWTGRKLMSDETLAAIVQDPRVEVHVLYVDGTPAGYVELDLSVEGHCEIAYFGIFPEFYGRGLGPRLLTWAVSRAAGLGVPRLWVHTCDLDHPKALGVYLKAGFVVYDERVEYVDPLPR